MNTKVWYLPYFEGIYHTQNANVRMVHMVHTMNHIIKRNNKTSPQLILSPRSLTSALLLLSPNFNNKFLL